MAKVKDRIKAPTDEELLAELASLDEASALIPGSADLDAGAVPQWCDLVLKLRRADSGAPINATFPLRRHDGELIIEVLHQVLHPQSGRSIVQKLWKELDEVVERIQRRVDADKEPLKRDVGQALGLATALANLLYPYSPDVDLVRADAMRRYYVRHGIEWDEDE